MLMLVLVLVLGLGVGLGLGLFEDLQSFRPLQSTKLLN